MTTKAQLLAAAKRIVAESEKEKRVAPKRNPAKRKGTARPNRKSQITGKAPTKRLVRRRRANDIAGYFPNPSAVKSAYTEEYPYYVFAENGDKSSTIIAKFRFSIHALDFAKAVAMRNKHTTYRVIDVKE